jgi:hypothetical protein
VTLSRRALASHSAWALPVVVLAVAAPGASASGEPAPDLSAFRLSSTCGVMGIVGPSFTLTAAETALPAGTTVGIASTGAPRLVRWTPDPEGMTVQTSDGFSTIFELTVDLLPGESIVFRGPTRIQAPYEITGIVDPAGDAIGTGSTSSARITADFTGTCTRG